ncbi:MAG: hypothetical protein JWO38_6836 [Gemmataceae bacterium]|nr:hypothetical protein [Gemmataceae bacterium]
MAAENTPRADGRADEEAGLCGGTGPCDVPPPVQVGGQPGGTNAIAPPGFSVVDPGKPARRSHGTRTAAQEDPEAAFEGSRHPPEAVARQVALDEALAETRPGTPDAAGEPGPPRNPPTE